MKDYFLPTLFIVFLVLKLTHVIDWSWLWVTCPLWAIIAIPLAGIIGMYFIVKPLITLNMKIRHKEKYEYLKKLDKNIKGRNKNKGGLFEKLKALQEERERMEAEKEEKSIH
jgi:hypothetical protein